MSAQHSEADSRRRDARRHPSGGRPLQQRKAALSNLSSASRPLYNINAAIREPLKRDKLVHGICEVKYRAWTSGIVAQMSEPPEGANWLSLAAICGRLPPPEEFLRRMGRAAQYSQGTETKGSGLMSIASSADPNLGLSNRSGPSLANSPSPPPPHASFLDNPYDVCHLPPMSPVLPPQRPNSRLNPGPALEDGMWSDDDELSASSEHALAKAHRRITRRAAKRYGTTPEEFQAGRSFR
ncbi:hypothetical protein JCM11641_001089 [Rhodosporidiobolus odoratus]